MADTDPPHKVNNRKAPAHRDVDAPDPRAFEQQITDGRLQHAREHGGNRNNDDPEDRGMPGEHYAGNAVRHGTEVLAGADDRRPYTFRWQCIRIIVKRHAYAFSPDSSSGFGLRTAPIYVVRGRVFKSASNA